MVSWIGLNEEGLTGTGHGGLVAKNRLSLDDSRVAAGAHPVGQGYFGVRPVGGTDRASAQALFHVDHGQYDERDEHCPPPGRRVERGRAE